MGIGGKSRNLRFLAGFGTESQRNPSFPTTRKRFFHFWRFHSGARFFFWGFAAPKAKTSKTFGGFGNPSAHRPVLGFSSASPQVVHRLFHTFVDIVDNLWASVDNSGISPIFPVFAGFFVFPQKVAQTRVNSPFSTR